MNFVPISLKTFYSANLYMSLNTCVSFRDLSCNRYAETIDCFRLSNNVYNKQYVFIVQAMSHIQKLHSIKPFNNIIHIEF